MNRDPERVGELTEGRLPIHEPYLERVIRESAERITYTTTLTEAVRSSEVLFVAVDTPQGEDGSANLASVTAVARDLGRALASGRESGSPLVVVNKSIMPVGSGDYVFMLYHLASPASPADFGRLAIQILRTGSAGTQNALDLALASGARFLLASTSEVYGDPLVHPQREDYRGNVDPVGPRGVYDEAKRYAEALTAAYHRRHGVETRIARIFNTYGPRMRLDDGRMVPNFVAHVLSGEPLTIHGEGTETRSVQCVEGLVRLMRSEEHCPANFGNPQEYTVRAVAEMVAGLSGGEKKLVRRPLPEGDPLGRCPDIGRTRESL